MTAQVNAPALGLVPRTQVSASGGPRIVAPSGTVTAGGALTLGTAMPILFAGGLWMYFPATAFASAAAGWYWVDFYSTTTGTVRTAPGGSVVAGTGSAYTGTTSEITAISSYIDVPDQDQSALLRVGFMCASNTNTKTARLRIGGTAVVTVTVNTVGQLYALATLQITGLGGGAVHAVNGTAGGGSSAGILLTGQSGQIQVDTTLQLAAATDYVGCVAPFTQR